MGRNTKEVKLKDKSGNDIASVETVYYKVDEPSYFKTYMKDLMKVLRISDSHYMVLGALLTRMDYNNQVNIYPLMRKDIAEEVGFKRVGSVNNSISMLAKSDVLIKLQSGSYLINPNYFARGGWDDIKRIRTAITYDESGKIVKVDFEKKESPQMPPQNI